MKRKTRFNDGGMNKNPFQGDDVDPFSAMRGEDGGIKKGDIPDAEPREAVGRMEGLPSKPKSFGQAFSEAEDGSTFMWNGKSYKKEYAGSPSKAPSLKDVPGSGRGSMPGRTASDDIMRDAGGGGRGRSMGRTAADEITYTPGRATGRAEIPVEAGARGPEKRTSDAMEMGDTERVLRTTLGAAAPGAVRAAPAVGRGIGSLMSAAKEGYKEGEKIKEVARAAERGAESRKAVQAARTARQKSEAEALEKAKPILQARKDTKPARAARTRRTEEDAGIEFSKGGSAASRRADGCAVRGKTRGKMY